MVDKTCDPQLKSFIDVDSDSHFPLQNLPYGLFRRADGGAARAGVRIGDFVLDLALLGERGLLDAPPLQRGLFSAPSLNDFLAQGPAVWRAAREIISSLLRSDNPTLRDDVELRQQALLPAGDVEMVMPVAIGDITDFHASKEHAVNIGTLLRGKDSSLPPNWVELPVASHRRSSSIVLSGSDVRRPRGQVMPEGAERPVHTHTHQLDFELEMGFFVGPGNRLGRPIPIAQASEHIFGMVLVNDWSARDIQKWESQPLGPFNSKNFATAISPWIVTLAALEPFRCPGPEQDPEPLDYLRCERSWAFDIDLEVWLKGSRMEGGRRICLSNFKHMYWNICQQLAHHTVTGCNVRPGDLMVSGTISAPQDDGFGSMLELTWRGTRPLIFANGEQRKFLADGDTITITGSCRGDGYRVGFGHVTGTVLPPLEA